MIDVDPWHVDLLDLALHPAAPSSTRIFTVADCMGTSVMNATFPSWLNIRGLDPAP